MLKNDYIWNLNYFIILDLFYVFSFLNVWICGLFKLRWEIGKMFVFVCNILLMSYV